MSNNIPLTWDQVNIISAAEKQGNITSFRGRRNRCRRPSYVERPSSDFASNTDYLHSSIETDYLHSSIESDTIWVLKH